MGAASSLSPVYKVAIVDDHPVVRQGLTQAIARESDLQVCQKPPALSMPCRRYKARRGRLCRRYLSRWRGWHRLIDYLKSRSSKAKILVYSAHDEETFAGRVLRAGALGFVNKREPIGKVIEAIRQVLRGEVYLSAEMTTNLLHRAAIGKTLDSDPVAALSDRELQVFQLIGEGLSTVQIADKLQLSPKTVESHRKTIKQKLNLETSAQLSRRAFQWAMEMH